MTNKVKATLDGVTEVEIELTDEQMALVRQGQIHSYSIAEPEGVEDDPLMIAYRECSIEHGRVIPGQHCIYCDEPRYKKHKGFCLTRMEGAREEWTIK